MVLQTYLSKELLLYSEVKHADWLKKVIGLATSNKSGLFQSR